jgi:hypothetical protein
MLYYLLNVHVGNKIMTYEIFVEFYEHHLSLVAGPRLA